MIDKNKIIEIFSEAGAILKGHFILSSGLHADTYFNKSLLVTKPHLTTKICQHLAELIKENFPNKEFSIVSPAMGAIIFGFEAARILNKEYFFLERAEHGFCFKRGFDPKKGDVCIIEDVISTGKSAKEAIIACKEHGLNPIAVFCFIDRSNNKADLLNVPLFPLCTLDVKTYEPDNLPDHLLGVKAIKMGSR